MARGRFLLSGALYCTGVFLLNIIVNDDCFETRRLIYTRNSSGLGAHRSELYVTCPAPTVFSFESQFFSRRGEEVSVESFLRLLTGRTLPGTPPSKVWNSSPVRKLSDCFARRSFLVFLEAVNLSLTGGF